MADTKRVELWDDNTDDLRDLMDMVEPGLTTHRTRKWRLFACACARRVESLTSWNRARRTIETVEQFADGHVGWRQIRELAEANVQNMESVDRLRTTNDGLARLAAMAVVYRAHDGSAFDIIDWLTEDAASATGNELAETRIQVVLIKDIFGNPFRPVPFEPSWHTSTVVALAEAIYADRAWDRMPILADALEEAGCNDARVLDHCRAYPVHARGCWVVDLVLGKT